MSRRRDPSSATCGTANGDDAADKSLAYPLSLARLLGFRDGWPITQVEKFTVVYGAVFPIGSVRFGAVG